MAISAAKADSQLKFSIDLLIANCIEKVRYHCIENSIYCNYNRKSQRLTPTTCKQFSYRDYPLADECCLSLPLTHSPSWILLVLQTPWRRKQTGGRRRERGCIPGILGSIDLHTHTHAHTCKLKTPYENESLFCDRVSYENKYVYVHYAALLLQLNFITEPLLWLH